jgi:prolyl-tRNA editing enzyme YbaK/EbsC (Cys-tRNA(Pro) deacylase)
MDPYEQKLADFIKANCIKAEQVVFATSCHSVEEAAISANAKPEDFVKNVCIINEETHELIVAIVPGAERLDMKKLIAIIGTKKLRFANAQEILERTSYPVGGTPSFGYNAIFYMDNKVMRHPFVFSGGGSPNALTKVAPSEMIRMNKAILAELSKE